jgi:hypothetical protein
MRASATDVWLSVSQASVVTQSIGNALKTRTVSVGPSQPMPPAVSRSSPSIRW